MYIRYMSFWEWLWWFGMGWGGVIRREGREEGRREGKDSI